MWSSTHIHTIYVPDSRFPQSLSKFSLSTSWPGTLHFILHTFLHPITVIAYTLTNTSTAQYDKINEISTEQSKANVKVSLIYCTHTHTSILRPSQLLSGTTQVSQHQKCKTKLHLLEHEIVSGSGISWAICKSALCPTQITMPASNHSVFLQARCPSCRPTTL